MAIASSRDRIIEMTCTEFPSRLGGSWLPLLEGVSVCVFVGEQSERATVQHRKEVSKHRTSSWTKSDGLCEHWHFMRWDGPVRSVSAPFNAGKAGKTDV